MTDGMLRYPEILKHMVAARPRPDVEELAADVKFQFKNFAIISYE